MKNRILMVIAGFLVAFGVGYVPQYLEIRSQTQELNSVRSQLEMQTALLERQRQLLPLTADLGLLLLEAEDRNYGVAGERSTRWFNGLNTLAGEIDDAELQRELAAIAGQRDEVTALLTRGDPTVVARLQAMYRSFTSAISQN